MGALKIKNPETGAWEYVGAPIEAVGMQIDLLWENPDPTTAFEAQTVALDLSQYDFVLISYEMFANYSAHATEIGLVGKTLQINSVDTSASWSTNINSFGRRMEIGNNGIVFRGGSLQGATSTVNDNRAIIPLQIYGLRNTSSSNPVGTGTTESIEHPGCFYRMVNGVQEWLNPPMELGVEYKTTERYLGKPVYVRLVDFGTMPNSARKAVALGSTSEARSTFRVIDAAAVDNTSFVLKGDMHDQISGTTIRFCSYCESGGGYCAFVITTTYNASGRTAKVYAKYYKTTD